MVKIKLDDNTLQSIKSIGNQWDDFDENEKLQYYLWLPCFLNVKNNSDIFILQYKDLPIDLREVLCKQLPKEMVKDLLSLNGKILNIK